MYLLGYDLGSSSAKASILDARTGRCLASSFFPDAEMEIIAVRPGWAEQHPSLWWAALAGATRRVLQSSGVRPEGIGAIGISYQMHGLVVVDRAGEPLRPAIIWCDSRAVEIGRRALLDLGADLCLSRLLNSPGNFTASRLKWVKENEPEVYSQIWKIMLPGDYIALRMTGEACTTVCGLSEGIFWDFGENRVSAALLDYFGFDVSLIPEVVPVFSVQGKLRRRAAEELGLRPGIPVAYRAGDQPNNAFSLNVLDPGEFAATAGTSGVVYGVTAEAACDPEGRVNTFAHVNHGPHTPRLGVLLCINGAGILYSWIRRNMFGGADYATVNELAAGVPAGSQGLRILPFGNGAERMLGNRDLGCAVAGLNFNVHDRAHLARAAQEAVAFAFRYGMGVMDSMGMRPAVLRAGHTNMFLSALFRETLADLTGAGIELFDTDGSQGAARAAGLGAGIYRSPAEAFAGLERILSVDPDHGRASATQAAYQDWCRFLDGQLQSETRQ